MKGEERQVVEYLNGSTTTWTIRNTKDFVSWSCTCVYFQNKPFTYMFVVSVTHKLSVVEKN